MKRIIKERRDKTSVSTSVENTKSTEGGLVELSRQRVQKGWGIQLNMRGWDVLHWRFPKLTVDNNAHLLLFERKGDSKGQALRQANTSFQIQALRFSPTQFDFT